MGSQRSSGSLWRSVIRLVCASAVLEGVCSLQNPSKELFGFGDPFSKLQDACPDYLDYSQLPHAPFSSGSFRVPFQRPAEQCRTFRSSAVEALIKDMKERLANPDLAQLFENAYPNTLDTTVRWHLASPDGPPSAKPPEQDQLNPDKQSWQAPQSFIVTGDINAEWLRDSTNQLAGYQALAKYDQALFGLIHGAINTQAEFVIRSPYCNAFQPPPVSGLRPTSNGQQDVVSPVYEPSAVFECKWEIDSLAAFFMLGNEFHENTDTYIFLGPRWFLAADAIMQVLEEQSQPTFDSDSGEWQQNRYRFRRKTDAGTETLALSGAGHPLNSGTGLVRSAFRPSDDATIFGYFIPGNAMMAVQLRKTAELLNKAITNFPSLSEKSGRDLAQIKELAKEMKERSETITNGIWKHGVVYSPAVDGPVFAFEVDGYGSQVMMDDANVPSLLSLPILDFVPLDYPAEDVHNKDPPGAGNAAYPPAQQPQLSPTYNRKDAATVYANTRKYLLSRATNPYFLVGPELSGIGGPHIGPQAAWPMSLLIEVLTAPARSSSSAGASTRLDVCHPRTFAHLDTVLRLHAELGLVHETVRVDEGAAGYTRSWFAWANSVFSQALLRVARECPNEAVAAAAARVGSSSNRGIFKPKGAAAGGPYDLAEAAKRWKMEGGKDAMVLA